jgi:hypothetical protein
MSVGNVEKPLVVPITFTYMKIFTVERNLTCVISVEKLSFIAIP